MNDKPIFYDTDCLASFLIIGKDFILQEMFSKIIIPTPVYDELFNESTPVIIKNNLKSLIKRGFVEVKDMSITSREYTAYRCIIDGLWGEKRLGRGEASVIAFAIENKGIVASNNLSDVKEFTDKYNLPLLTTAIILAKAVESHLINESKANKLWKKMLEKNRNLPDDSFSNYYQNKYKTDCDDFFLNRWE
ncbi:MAG: hypothetical protein FWH29_05375 [Methanobrevibacter sp.]|nr:hypothetical protein [Methanobrevibacter sp.]